jgi:cytochrome c oxidase subunit IV
MTNHEQRNGAGAEEIHLPGPSLVPLFTAAGVTIALLGLVLSWWFVAAGSLIALIAIVRWIRDVREDIGSLPTSRH